MVAITQKIGAEQTCLLDLYRTTVPLINDSLLRHKHNILVRDLPGLDTSISRVQGSLIATYVGQGSVKQRQNQEEKAQLWAHMESKVVTKFFGTNLVYLFCLAQVW